MPRISRRSRATSIRLYSQVPSEDRRPTAAEQRADGAQEGFNICACRTKSTAQPPPRRLGVPFPGSSGPSGMPPEMPRDAHSRQQRPFPGPAGTWQHRATERGRPVRDHRAGLQAALRVADCTHRCRRRRRSYLPPETQAGSKRRREAPSLPTAPGKVSG